MKLGIKWGIVNAILLLGLYGAYLDQAWRSSCETSGECMSQVSSVSLWPFTMVTSLSSNGVPLQSPLTLDWIQVMLIALIVVNAYLAFVWLRRRPSTTVV